MNAIDRQRMKTGQRIFRLKRICCWCGIVFA
jgi:hypothetical protein